MITEKDLQEAIAECKGVRNPDANTCIKLASFLIILKEMYGSQDSVDVPAYSFSAGNVINFDSGSEFSQKINGKDQKGVIMVMDELMDMLHVLYPKIYDSVMRKL